MVLEVSVRLVKQLILVIARFLHLLLFSPSDSCKFLHDRSDYKHGWQIERELEEGRYGANGELQKWLKGLLLICVVCERFVKLPFSSRRGELRGEQR